MLQGSLLDKWALRNMTALAVGLLSACVLPPAEPTTTRAAQRDAWPPTPPGRRHRTRSHCCQTRHRHRHKPLGFAAALLVAAVRGSWPSTPEMHPPGLCTKQKQMYLCQELGNPGGALGHGACCAMQSQGTGRSDCTRLSEGTQGFPSRSAFGCGRGGRWVSTHLCHQQGLQFSCLPLSALPAADPRMCHWALLGLLVGLGILRLQNSPQAPGLLDGLLALASEGARAASSVGEG